jgi:hypothetical protein
MSGLLAHLDGQISSSQRLLKVLLAQTDAIRRQDVESVLARLSDIQTELLERERLERDRDTLLRDYSARLGLHADELTLEDILEQLPAAEASAARDRSAELKGLVGEVQRVHEQNRLLIRQELSFLDHLMRLLSGAPQGGYTARGYTPAAPAPALGSLNVRA